MVNEDKSVNNFVGGAGAKPKHGKGHAGAHKHKSKSKSKQKDMTEKKIREKKSKKKRQGVEKNLVHLKIAQLRGKMCKMFNHFASECRFKSIHFVEESGSESPESEDNFYILTINNDSDSEFSEIIQINNKRVKFQLDSGAKCNIMKLESFKKLKLKLPLGESKTC